MSFLDMYSGDQAADAAIRPNEGTNLPATFGDTFGAAWSEGQLFSQSIAHQNARAAALQDHVDDVERQSGKKIDWMNDADYGTADQISGAVPFPTMPDLAKVNAATSKLGIPELSDDDLDQRAVAKSRAAQADYADMAGQEKTTGGRIGFALGGMASAATDPINLLALPVAPEMEGVSILGAALRWGAIAGGAQTAIEVAGAPYHEQVQPGYGASGEPLANIAEAVGGGFFLGGATKALGNAWTRVKTGSWPTSVRDAGNIAESEANVANTNVYSGVAGEAAHRDALANSIDSILGEKPVDVSQIITPDIEASSRNLMVRLEDEQAASLPAFDQRSIALLSEEAGLRARDADLAGQARQLPEGNPTAADRLNRLQAVEQQMRDATDPAAQRQLAERRDQILVDTTPEQLQAEAAPFEQGRALDAERGQIAGRLAEIADERARTRAENLSPVPEAMIGQRQPIRPTPSIDELRQLAGSTADIAGQERAAQPVAGKDYGADADVQRLGEIQKDGIVGFNALNGQVRLKDGREFNVSQGAGTIWGPNGIEIDPKLVAAFRQGDHWIPTKAKGATSPVAAPELPFKATAAEAQARTSADALTSGVTQIAARAGYDMPKEEAAKIADALARMSPEDAQDALRTLQESPRQAAATMERPPAFPAPASPAAPNSDVLHSTLASPDYQTALRADIDRERMTADRQIPVDVDKDGNPVYRSLDGMADEVDAYNKAADQIAACAAPVAKEAA